MSSFGAEKNTATELRSSAERLIGKLAYIETTDRRSFVGWIRRVNSKGIEFDYRREDDKIIQEELAWSKVRDISPALV